MKWNIEHNVRENLFRFTKENIYHTPEGATMPRGLQVLWVVFFPLRWFRYVRLTNIYDPLTGTYNLNGIRFTEEFLYDILPREWMRWYEEKKGAET